ncbi:MAG: hypothetical protein JO064_12505 [Actinobacteria bacterium]|nr:hypothetical protein [Actinomycetota bacterium]MBV8599293.1 hypothetical protein [Actinomycetota bacterium]
MSFGEHLFRLPRLAPTVATTEAGSIAKRRTNMAKPKAKAKTKAKTTTKKKK